MDSVEFGVEMLRGAKVNGPLGKGPIINESLVELGVVELYLT